MCDLQGDPEWDAGISNCLRVFENWRNTVRNGRACDGRVRPGEDFKKPLSRDQSFIPVKKTKDQKYAHVEGTVLL